MLVSIHEEEVPKLMYILSWCNKPVCLGIIFSQFQGALMEGIEGATWFWYLRLHKQKKNISHDHAHSKKGKNG